MQNLQRKHTMDRNIFHCSKCNFFPLQIQLQNLFLNSDTFKCPVCEQLVKFDKKIHYLLEKQYYLQEIGKFSGNRDMETFNNITRKENLQNCQSISYLIFIQVNDKLRNQLYLNPINRQLQNSFNISKSQVLRNNKHLFFCINDQISRQIGLKNNITLYKRQLIKHRVRRISKIQHFWYCLDTYINKIISSDQIKNKKIILKSFKKKSNRQLPNVNQNNSTLQTQKDKIYTFSLLDSVQFELQTYVKFQKQAQQNTKQNVKIQLNADLKKLQNQLRKIVLNFNQMLGQEQFESIKQTNNYFKVNNLKSVTIFTQSFNKVQIQNLIKLLYSNVENNSNKNNLTYKIPICNFYFQYQTCLHQKKIKQRGLREQVKSQMILENIFYHTSLYVPHHKDKLNNQIIFQEIIKLTSKNKQSQNTAFDLLMKEKNKNKLYSKKDIQIATAQQNQDSKQFTNNQILAFWQLNVKQNKRLKVNKLKLKSLFKILSQAITVLQLKNIDQFSLRINNFLKHQIVEAVEKHQKLKTDNIVKSQINIKLDRIYCVLGQSNFYYVFDYGQKIKENYDQLDFLGQNSLPEQLRNYSRTYQNVYISKLKKIQNQFKKGNFRVYMIKQKQTNKFPQFSDNEDDDRQTL